MLTKDEVFAVLQTVPDPEVPVISVVELGVVRDVVITPDGVTVTMTPTYSGCPAMREMEADVKAALLARGVPNVTVHTNAQTTEITGDGSKVNGIRYKDRATGTEHHVELAGVFVGVGAQKHQRPPTNRSSEKRPE